MLSVLRISFALAIGFSVGCSKAEDPAPGATGGGPSEAGGSSAGGAGAGGGGGGGFGAVDSGVGGNVGQNRSDCDARNIVCLPIVPIEPCEPMFVHRIDHGCYGPCVPIEECECQERLDCPDPDGTEAYTCILSANHCSPWLQ